MPKPSLAIFAKSKGQTEFSMGYRLKCNFLGMMTSSIKSFNVNVSFLIKVLQKVIAGFFLDAISSVLTIFFRLVLV